MPHLKRPTYWNEQSKNRFNNLTTFQWFLREEFTTTEQDNTLLTQQEWTFVFKLYPKNTTKVFCSLHSQDYYLWNNSLTYSFLGGGKYVSKPHKITIFCLLVKHICTCLNKSILASHFPVGDLPQIGLKSTPERDQYSACITVCFVVMTDPLLGRCENVTKWLLTQHHMIDYVQYKINSEILRNTLMFSSLDAFFFKAPCVYSLLVYFRKPLAS